MNSQLYKRLKLNTRSLSYQLPMPDELSTEELHRKAEELRALSTKLNAQFTAKMAEHEKAMHKFRFFSNDRKSLWQMPAWLWVPIVVILSLLLALSFVVTK